MAENNITKYVGNKIKYFRESKNITQQELAEAMNTSQQSIARYESGERKADQNILFQLATYFNVSINEFFPEIKNHDSSPGRFPESKSKPHLSHLSGIFITQPQTLHLNTLPSFSLRIKLLHLGHLIDSPQFSQKTSEASPNLFRIQTTF